jgi:hypothetical protein
MREILHGSRAQREAARQNILMVTARKIGEGAK